MLWGKYYFICIIFLNSPKPYEVGRYYLYLYYTGEETEAQGEK